MQTDIRIGDLYDCNEGEEQKGYRVRNHKFHLGELPTPELREEMYKYILQRAEKLTVLSLKSEQRSFHVFARFISSVYPDMKSICEVSPPKLIRAYKKWLMANNYSLVSRQYKRDIGRYKERETELVSYLRRMIEAFTPKDSREEHKKDIWDLKKIKIHLIENPIKPTSTINFNAISQEKMKMETKEAVQVGIRYLAIGTILAEISAVKRLSWFLKTRFPGVQSYEDLNREIIESYLSYLATEAQGKKTFREELLHLKGLLDRVGKIAESENISHLICATDIPRSVGKVFECYSDEELDRLNEAFSKLDIQIRRALVIHQLLGTRISDTLTLNRECLSKVNGKDVITIYQIKTRRNFQKTITPETRLLIEAAIEDSILHYPETSYIFVNKNNPKRAMSYGYIRYHIMAVITEEGIKDDQGRKFGFKTHMFRTTYGKKLTEMNVDDAVIAKLLGHSGLSSVNRYRRISDNRIAEDTKDIREKKNEILERIIEEWK